MKPLPSESPPLLRVVAVSKQYPTAHGDLSVLRNLSLELSAHEAIAIMGPSGSGKSTLLGILGAMEPPSGGFVSLAGVDPFTLREPELARFRNRQIGFVFQNHYLLPQCSALENVLIPTLPAPADPNHAERARTLLTRVGLQKRFDHRPSELSGGENQRVVVARALINRPSLLLADEPTGNLDQHAAEAVVELLLEVHREEHAGLIMVTHSPALAARFDKQYILSDGRLSAG